MKSVLLVLLVCAVLPLGVLSSSEWTSATLVDELEATKHNEVMVGLELTSSMAEESMPAGSIMEAQSQGADMTTAPSSFVETETETDAEWRGLRRPRSHSRRFHSSLRRLRSASARRQGSHPYYARHAYGYNTPAFGFGGNGYAGQVTDIHPYSTRLYHPGYVAGFTNDRRHQPIPLPPQMPFLPPPPYTTPREVPIAAAPAASSF